MTEEEVRADMRAAGKSRVEEVGAVILETDGSFSVLGMSDQPASAANQDVRGYPRAI